MMLMKDDVRYVIHPSPSKIDGKDKQFTRGKKLKVIGGFKMKKLSYVLVGFVLLAFLISFTMNTPLLAQEKEEEVEDVMDMALEDLLNVEITTAGKKAEKISEIPASIVLVTREDIEKYGYQTLAEVLESIPGLYLTDDYLSKNLGVRGFWTVDPNRNMIILVNGVSQVEDTFSVYDLKQINLPVEAIDRVEVVRGPMSVIYGSGAFFGVINIKTNIVDEKPLNMVAAGVGSEKTYKMFARSSGNSGDFKYSFNGSYSDTYGIDQPYNKMVSDPSILPVFGVPESQTTKGQLENTEKYFNFSGTFKNFQFDASYTDAQREFVLFFPNVSDGSESFIRSMRVAFSYNFKISEKVKMDAKFDYYHYRREVPKYDWGYFGIQNDGSSGYNVELNLFYEPSSKFDIMVGVNYHNAFDILNSLSIPAFGLTNYRGEVDGIVTQSIFTQFNLKLSDKLKIVAGARLEQVPEYNYFSIIDGGLATEFTIESVIDQSDVEFIPRFALIYSPNESNVLKFLYGKAINRPSFYQFGDNFFAGATYMLSPEEIQTFELNYFGQLSPKFSVNLSLFRNMLDKLIFNTTTLVGTDYSTYYTNVGEMTTNGIELSIQAKPFNGFFLDLSGTYQDTEDKREGMSDVETGYSPKFMAYLKASYAFNKDITFAVTGNYIDGMESYYDTTIPGRLGEPVESYFLLGANLRFRNLFGKGFFLNIRGSNLLDEEIHYPATSHNLYFATNGTIGRGLSFLVTIGKKW